MLKITKNFEITYHYTCIRNLSKLLSKQVSQHGHTLFFCDRCLNYFSTQTLAKCHFLPINICTYFKNYKYKEAVPFIIYSDIEALLKPLENDIRNKTKKYQKQAFTLGYCFHCTCDNIKKNLSYYKSYEGLDCVTWFVRELENINKFVESKLKTILGLVQGENCHICEKPFQEGDNPVRDHCHSRGNLGVGPTPLVI
ncbi:hypothetical protein NQ315_003692 [Exocentrus adspersus]|uniref:Uncharacterized protein n=1 Tax=Exocentrus adspersus TaxID=1586481 RepID=A0AAV8V9P2_9CUCU|nr:hypothetical protein NQ315_003692 [Exocentrus adspersus]